MRWAIAANVAGDSLTWLVPRKHHHKRRQNKRKGVPEASVEHSDLKTLCCLRWAPVYLMCMPCGHFVARISSRVSVSQSDVRRCQRSDGVGQVVHKGFN